jgi:hypothetical protein
VGLRGVGFGRLSIDDMQVAMLLAPARATR